MIKGHIKYCLCEDCDEDGAMAKLAHYQDRNRHVSNRKCYCKNCDPDKKKIESDRVKLLQRRWRSW